MSLLPRRQMSSCSSGTRSRLGLYVILPLVRKAWGKGTFLYIRSSYARRTLRGSLRFGRGGLGSICPLKGQLLLTSADGGQVVLWTQHCQNYWNFRRSWKSGFLFEIVPSFKCDLQVFGPNGRIIGQTSLRTASLWGALLLHPSHLCFLCSSPCIRSSSSGLPPAKVPSCSSS